jgi:thiamine kinase-like enzyme
MMLSAQSLLSEKFTKQICYLLLPEWQGCEINISELSGGNTNKLYRVKSVKGDYSVRIFGDKTDLYINRDYEVDAIAKMADLGISSKLVKYLPELGVTIVEFIDNSITLGNKHFLDRSLYAKITEPIRKIHSSRIRLEKIFNPLIEVKKMADILHNRLGVHHPEFEIDATLERLERLSEMIRIPETEYTACHNDLVAENFICINPGFEQHYASAMFIIDWEYAGMSPRYYDLADMFQEVLVPRESEKQIVMEYCQGMEFDTTLYYTDMFKPFPDMYWFIWSLVQKQISNKNFPFYTYGKAKYENALLTLKLLNKEYGIDL